jgi:hypothetical protein
MENIMKRPVSLKFIVIIKIENILLSSSWNYIRY